MADPAKTIDQNILPVQALFNLDNTFNTFIGQGQPFYATVNPSQSGLAITNSTIDSTTIGATTPSTGVFTNVSTTTGTIVTAPSGNTDITNKAYVDAVAQGLNPKGAVKCATTASITLSGLQTIDGYTTLAGDRVLVKNQTSTPTNGIYIAAAGAWTRSTDMDVWAEVPGAYCVVLYGSSNGNTAWVSTSADTGTIGTTPITFVQFAGTGTYFAGTGLTLASNTFSITNTGVTAASYGSASSVPVLAINAQGQVTSASSSAIAIAASQITSGTIASSLISGSYTGITGVGTLTVGVWNGSAIANAYLANSSITINGNSVSLGSSTTVTANTPNVLTFNNSGTGGASGITFNGGAAQTVSYNTIGAPSTTGTNASGTWGINVTGNAATVTNGLYSTGSYSNPSWLTSILGSIVSGAVASATLAASATNVAGGTAGALPYQTGSSATSFLGLGTTNFVLTAGSSAPQYVAQSTLSVGSATTATTATNLAGGGAGYVPYQSGAGATSFLSAGTTGQVLTSNGSGAPTWSTPATAVTLSDDTTTAATRYPLFASATSGSASTIYTSSTKYQYNPSTGVLTATQFSGSGAGLTSIPNSALTNSSVTVGSTAISLGGTATTLAGLSSVTSTTFVGALTGNASTATTATTATSATNTAITDNTSSSATWYPTIVSTTTGNLPQTTSSTKLSFVPSTGALTASAFIANQSISGSATQGAFAYGTLNSSDTGIFASYQTSIAGYAYMALQNTSSNAAATTDIALYNDTASLGKYIDIGINSSAFTGTGNFSLANAGYIYTNGGDLVLGTYGSNGIHFIINNGATDAMTIATTGAVTANTSVTSPVVTVSNGIHVNSKTVSASYTIPSGSSAMSAGPMTVATGQTVTISSGSRWVIL